MIDVNDVKISLENLLDPIGKTGVLFLFYLNRPRYGKVARTNYFLLCAQKWVLLQAVSLEMGSMV